MDAGNGGRRRHVVWGAESSGGGWRVAGAAFCAGGGGWVQVQERGDTTMNTTDQVEVGQKGGTKISRKTVETGGAGGIEQNI